MHKVVYNACYGGFSLSLKAVDWLEHNSKDNSLLAHIEECKEDIKHSAERVKCSVKYFNDLLCCGVSRYFDGYRHHKDLVAVVEALGDKANGECAKLEIANVGNQYRIDEYDGAEEVVTPEGSDWIIIQD